MIRQYLWDIINDHKDEWKIQLSIRISFVRSVDSEDSKDSEDSNKPRIMYTNRLAMKQMKSLKNFLNLF